MEKDNIISIDKFIFLLLSSKPEIKMKIPSVKFWAMTLIMIGAGLNIQMKDGHILTIEDCWIEMDDCASGDCYRSTEARRIIEYLNQKRNYFGW